MDGKSLDILSEKLNKLKKLVPEAFTEDKIDWEKLKLTLGDDLNLSEERYHLNWAGKSEVFRVLQQRTAATLLPVKDKSVNFDETENVFIEGENLEVLKVLQKSYFGKIKMIYIDPPYNTGNDSFIYPDKFSETKADYLKRIGDKDDEGYLLKEGMFRKNSKDAGHYHSNWLTMMFPRLYLARNLLRDDGVIFVSIDDNEVHNLRMIMNEIFGEENFIAVFPWRKRTAKSDVPFRISQDYEWIIAYAKNDSFKAGIVRNTRKYYETPDLPNRPWRIHEMTTHRTAAERPNSNFTIINPKTGDEYSVNPNAVWRITRSSFQKFLKENRIVFPGDYKFLNFSKPVLRYFKDEDISKAGGEFGVVSVSTHLQKEIGMTQDGTKDMGDLFEDKIFGFPKPVNLIKYFIGICTAIDKSALILDFFAGSGTTAQAVMELNKEDRGNRKFILVQLPEKTKEDSEADKAGYKTIADICKERVRRVIKKLETENEQTKDKSQTELELKSGSHSVPQDAGSESPEKLKQVQLETMGFKVFKLSPSNFKIWRSDIVETEEDLNKMVNIFDSQVKDGSKEENMLYELMLKSGYALTDKVEKKNGYYSISNGELVIVLSKIKQKQINEILSIKPKNCIMLDKLFAGNDQLKTNTSLQFKDAQIEFTTV